MAGPSPRRNKRKQANKPETLDLSGSQPPTPPPGGEKKRNASDASASKSTTPPRVGHARSYSSPASAAAKAKAAPASSPCFSAGRGGGWSATRHDDGLDDFAFDKMSVDSDGDGDEDEDEEGQAAGGASKAKKSIPPPKKKRATATARAKATDMSAQKASSSGGRGKATSAVGVGPKHAGRKPPAKKSGPTAGPGPGAGAAAAPASTKKRSARSKVVKVVDLSDLDSDDSGDGSDDGSDWDEDLGSIAAKKQKNNSGGKKKGKAASKSKTAATGGTRKIRASPSPSPSPSPSSLSEGDGSASDGGPKGSSSSVAVATAQRGARRAKAGAAAAARSDSDEDFLLHDDNDSSSSSRAGAVNVTTATAAAPRRRRPSSASSSSKVLAVGGKGMDVDLTEEGESGEEADSGLGERATAPSASKNKNTTTAGVGAAKAKGKQAGAGKKGKGKAKEGGARRSAMSSAKPAKLAADVEVVLRRLRKLKGEMVRGGGGGGGGSGGGGGAASDGGDDGGKKVPTLLDLGLSGDVTEVREMGAAGVMDEIERIAVETALSIMDEKGFSFRVPTRSAGNQKYVEELDRIVLGDKVSHRNFVSTAMARKTAITTRVIELVHQVLGKGIHITKRDMFYTDVKLFKDQSESDNVLDDVACMVGCTRSCLNVVASDKGLVVGRVTFLEDGDLIDCTRMGVGGKAIPPYVDKITDIRSDADFILLVEKEAAYMRMAEDRFYQKYPCIVITAKGQPDVATRLFLKRLKRELNIPVMGLVDSDPYGLKILSVYMSGSKNMSYDSASLTTPDIKWLGVRPSDLDRYNIPEQCRLDMTDHDIRTGKELLQEAFIQKNEPWCRELELMIKSKKKAEIQSLSAFGFQYLTHTYLPQKLQNGDWI